MAKVRQQVQVRLNEEQVGMLKRLSEDYGVSKSELIMYALGYVEKNRPNFVVQKVVKSTTRSQGKELALASMTA